MKCRGQLRFARLGPPPGIGGTVWFVIMGLGKCLGAVLHFSLCLDKAGLRIAFAPPDCILGPGPSAFRNAPPGQRRGYAATPCFAGDSRLKLVLLGCELDLVFPISCAPARPSGRSVSLIRLLTLGFALAGPSFKLRPGVQQRRFPARARRRCCQNRHRPNGTRRDAIKRLTCGGKGMRFLPPGHERRIGFVGHPAGQVRGSSRTHRARCCGRH